MYCNLLRLARVSDDTKYTEEKRIKAIYALNQLPLYAKVHWRLLPLLNAKAKQLNLFDQLDITVQGLLKVETQKGVIRELAKEQQLTEIINVLAEQGIPIILLKGTAFANDLYNKSSPRLSNDIDILIKKSDWKQALLIIKEIMDYREKLIPGVFGDLYEKSFVPKGKLGAALDLHLYLDNPILFNIDESELWGDSIVHSYYDNNLVRKLSPEHSIIHQAMQSFKDADFFKYNLVDCWELIKNNNIDVSKIEKTSSDWGVRYILFYFLESFKAITDSEIKLLKKTSKTIFFGKRLMMDNFSSVKSCENKTLMDKSLFKVCQLMYQFAYLDSFTRLLKYLFLYFNKITLIR